MIVGGSVIAGLLLIAAFVFYGGDDSPEVGQLAANNSRSDKAAASGDDSPGNLDSDDATSVIASGPSEATTAPTRDITPVSTPDEPAAMPATTAATLPDPASIFPATSVPEADSSSDVISLTDSVDWDDWRCQQQGGLAAGDEGGWQLDGSGVLSATGLPGYGNLFTAREFTDFELSLDYRLTAGANSGILFRATGGGGMWGDQFLEIQLHDDDGWRPNKPGVVLKPEQRNGSMYGMAAPWKPAGKTVGQWNSLVLKSVDSQVTVTLNGSQIIDLDLLTSPETQPFLNEKPALRRRSGLIGLQKHTGDVAFRNLQIKDLTQPASAVDGTLNYGDWIDLLEGNSLAAWQASPGTLKAQQAVSLTQRQFAQRTADSLVRQHWQVRNGELQFSGLKAPSLSTRKSYTDFELSLDWKIAKGGDSGVYLRGLPQVQIWDPDVSLGDDASSGSGGLFNNQTQPRLPLVRADRPVGQWNEMLIRMVGEKVTVDLNGRRVVDNVVMENYDDRTQPVYATGPIELQRHSGPLWFRNIRIRELTAVAFTGEVSESDSIEPVVSGVPALNGGQIDAYQWVSPDGLTIYWTREGIVNKPSMIWTATRASANAPFANVRPLLEGRQASLSGDQLEVVLLKDLKLCVARRSSVAASFSPPAPVRALESAGNPNKCAWLSDDALTLLFGRLVAEQSELMASTRDSRSAAWNVPRRVQMPGSMKLFQWPSLSSDHRTLFLAGGGGREGKLKVAHRDRIDQPFTDFQDIVVDGTSLSGRSPRYVESTKELWFCTAPDVTRNEWELRVVKNYTPPWPIERDQQSSQPVAAQPAENWIPLFNGRTPTRPKRVAFVAGVRSHGYGSHEHKAGSILLARSLGKAMPTFVTAVYTDGWPKDPHALDGFDCIVMYCDGGRSHMVNPYLDQVDAYAKSGVGIVALHYGVEVEVSPAGGKFLDWMGGYFEAHWSVNPHWTANYRKFPKHPITRGVKPFSVNDEWYYHMRFRPDMKGVIPILTDLPPASTLVKEDGSLARPDNAHNNNPHVREAVLVRKEPQHMAWASVNEGGGRGFGFTGGHNHWNWGNPEYRKVVLNAVVWCAQREVPEGGVESPEVTLEDLQADQDYDPKPDFNAGAIQKQLDAWNGRASLSLAPDGVPRLQPEPEKTPKTAGDGKLFQSPVVSKQTKGHAVDIDVAVKGAKKLWLVATDGGDGFGCDWADWVNPRFVGRNGEKSLTELKWKSAATGFGQVNVNKNAGGRATTSYCRQTWITGRAWTVVRQNGRSGMDMWK